MNPSSSSTSWPRQDKTAALAHDAQLLQQRGLTVDQVAHQLGVDRRTVQRWLSR